MPRLWDTVLRAADWQVNQLRIRVGEVGYNSTHSTGQALEPEGTREDWEPRAGGPAPPWKAPATTGRCYLGKGCGWDREKGRKNSGGEQGSVLTLGEGQWVRSHKGDSLGCTCHAEGQRLHWCQGFIIAGLESIAKEGGLYSGVGIKWGMPTEILSGEVGWSHPRFIRVILVAAAGDTTSGGARGWWGVGSGNDGDSELGGG